MAIVMDSKDLLCPSKSTNSTTRGVAIAPVASLVLLGGCLAIALHTPAQAKPTPDPVFGTQNPFATLAPPTLNSAKNDFQQLAQTKQYYDIDGYLVFVNRYSPNLLELVRQVDRSANRVRFKGRDVIQLGIYKHRSTAERRLRTLANQGIIAEIATVDVRQIARQFLVYVINDDPLLLEEVLKVAPYASPVYYKGRNVIQAGLFDDELNAARLVRRLRDRRIIARIDQIQFEENRARLQTVSNEPTTEASVDKYYSVMIPCSEDELPYVASQVRQMVPDMDFNRGIYTRDGADGPYVMVGPFRDRETAEKWTRYLRDFGLDDARIYSGR